METQPYTGLHRLMKQAAHQALRVITPLVLGTLAFPFQAIAAELLPAARQGSMKDCREVVFAVRGVGPDDHWYANFGKYAPQRMYHIPLFPSGSSLRVLDLDTGTQRVLLDDPKRGIRDPQVHYNGEKILFSYRPRDSPRYPDPYTQIQTGTPMSRWRLDGGEWIEDF